MYGDTSGQIRSNCGASAGVKYNSRTLKSVFHKCKKRQFTLRLRPDLTTLNLFQIQLKPTKESSLPLKPAVTLEGLYKNTHNDIGTLGYCLTVPYLHCSLGTIYQDENQYHSAVRVHCTKPKRSCQTVAWLDSSPVWAYSGRPHNVFVQQSADGEASCPSCPPPFVNRPGSSR